MAVGAHNRSSFSERSGTIISDRRDSYRFDVHEAARVELNAVRLPVADLSASGMGLLMPGRHLRSLHAGRALFQLGADHTFEAKFDTVSASLVGADQFRVGTRFRRLDRDAMRKLSQFLMGELMSRSGSASRRMEARAALLSEDPRFITALLRYHGVARQRPLRAFAGDAALPTHLSVLCVPEEGGLQVASLEPLPATVAPGAELSFLLSTGAAALWFNATVLWAEPHRAELRMPSAIVRSGFRDSLRASASGVELSFAHPRLPVTLRKQTIDVSARGLSFPLDQRRDIIFPGDHLSPLRIRLPDGQVQGTGIVRSVRRLEDGSMGCGLELVELDDPERWSRAVFRLGHPNLLLSEGDAPDGAWRSLDSSGYVSLWTHPEGLEMARQEFRSHWQAMPREHGQLLVVKRDRRAVGTIAANRLFEKTWMMHLLGVDEEIRKRQDRTSFYQVIRELYSGLTFMLQHLTDLQYLVGYFAADSHWNTALHVDFEREYPVSSHLATSRYSIFRPSEAPSTTAPEPPDGLPPVRPLSPADVPQVGAGLALRFSPMELDAYDLQEDRLLEDRFGRRCKSDGYERARASYVVESPGGDLAALLLLETGSERINLFNLLNTCRLIPLRDLGAAHAKVRAAALHHAWLHYARAGKRSHLFFDYGAVGELAEEHPGYRYLCEGVGWLLRREALPAWLSFIDDLLGIKTAGRQGSGGQR